MKNIITTVFVLFSFFLFSQTGPGGVGNTNGTSTLKVWYNPNNTNTVTVSSGKITGLTNAAGVSVLDLTATTSIAPTLNIGTQNGYDEMDFSGSKLLESNTGLNTSNFVTNAATSFIVSNANNIHASMPYRTNLSGGSNRFLCHLPWSNGRIYFDLGNTGAGRIYKAGLTGITSYNIWAYEGNPSTKNLYQNSAQKHVVNSGAATFTASSSTTFQIGKNYQGQMTEVIVFKEKIGQTKRRIIDNYLAAKYDLTLEVGDYYTQDDATNGNFDHNVAGIGQVSITDNHTDSQGTGIIRINTPSALSNDDYLFWGEETKNATYDFTTITSDYSERLNSKWRVSKQNNLGTVSVSVNESNIIFHSIYGCNDLKLIVSNDATFATKTSYSMILSGGVYTANLVSFTDGDYFTFEYIDKIVVDNTGYYNGSGFANVPNTSDGCYKFLVKSTANGLLPLTQGGNVREIEVETNGVLAINNGLRLSVSDGIQLDGNIRLFGTSQLIQTHTGTSKVTGSGKLYIDKKSELTNVYQSGFWTSPVATGTNTFTIDAAMKDGTIPTNAGSIPPNINFISGYDGATTTPISISKYWLAKLVDDTVWNRHGDETTTHNIAEGYNMKSSGANKQNYTFVGKPNDGNYSIPVSLGKSTLLGNPYPSSLDADVFLLNNTGIINTLYFWDGTNDTSNSHVRNSYAGGYATRAIGLGTAYNSGAIPARYIQVAQGFFIDAIVNGTINFKNSQRVFNNSSPSFSREEPFPILRIGFDFNIDSNNSFHRQLAVGFRGLTPNYEAGYDAIMYDMRATDISLKVINNDNEFVITGIEDYIDTITIPMHVVLDQQRDITFSIDAFENFTPNEIYLKDTNTNMYYNLINNVTLNLPAGDYTNRFEITFRQQNTAAINDYVKESALVIIDNLDSMTINSKGNTIITNVKIFNLIGQKLTDVNVKNTQVTIPLKLTKGEIFITKITLMNGQTIVKKLLKK